MSLLYWKRAASLTIFARSMNLLIYFVSLVISDNFHWLPELGEFWLPRDDVRGGCGPVGGLPLFRGLPGGRVSVMDIKLAIGRNGEVIDESPKETAGRAIVAG